MLTKLVKVYEKQLFSPSSNIHGGKEAAEESKMFMKETAAHASKKWLIAGVCHLDLFLCRNSLFI